MNNRVEVKTQAELDAAIKAGDIAICVSGSFALRGHSTATLRGHSTATLWDNSTATLCGNSTATLRGHSTATLLDNSTATLWDNSTATLLDNSTAILLDNSTATLWGHSTATLWDNSTATLLDNSTATLCGNSTATLWGNSTATLLDNSTATAYSNVFLRVFSCLKITAGTHVVIMDHGNNKSKITGGKIIKAFKPKTALQWCRHWGVKVEKKIAILFKGVDGKYMSERGGNYAPTTIPVAPDWDGGKKECGGGLHFSPHPILTHDFCNPKKYIACPVALKDIAVHPDGNYPQKVKARGCCAPVWEVNKDGEKI